MNAILKFSQTIKDSQSHAELTYSQDIKILKIISFVVTVFFYSRAELVSR